MDANELKTILELHVKWLRGHAEGKRADLTDANLTDADLTDADLTRANLTRADLTDADLTRANLTDADLTRANLTPVRDDIWSVLSASPKEAEGLLAALSEGRVDGSCYEGECCCLVGTLANIRGCYYADIPGLEPASERAAERFFMGIRKGDTPEKSQACKLAHEWVGDWIGRMKSAFAPAA